MWEPPPILGKMVSGISMTIVVGAICNDSPDYRERCWELCARANHQYTFWGVVKIVVLSQYIYWGTWSNEKTGTVVLL